MLTTNPIQLRKQIDTKIKSFYELSIVDKYFAWKIIKDIKFANQIIENHKIVNFKEASSDYYKLEESSFEELLEKPMTRLKGFTDGLLKAEILAKINK